MNYVITQNGVLIHSDIIEYQINTDRSVYEVIRIVDGIALFLEDHFNRLTSSVQISGLEFKMEFLEFRRHIVQLVQLNRKSNGNVKLILSNVGGIVNWSFSFIPHSYPTAKDYQNGVATGLLFAERENPNAKVIQNSVRQKANELIGTHQLYEVLLVDKKGLITEGSRSNVFFVKGNHFYTAPEAAVLVGITRQKVLDRLQELNYTIVDKAVAVSEIQTFDAVFLTGTSPKVLPVNCIDDVRYFAKNQFVEQLMEKYDKMIETYLKAHNG